MSSYLIPIETAFLVFLISSIFLVIPWVIYSYRKYHYFSIWATIITYSLIFYMLSALFLVLLPLPDTRDTCAMQTADTLHYQLIPFYFVWDTLKGSPVVWSQPATYIHLFRQAAFLPAAYNFLLLLPLGVYLRYFFRKRHYWKRALLIGFCVSLFFEVTQLTGIYGLYNCPYRVFNVDDLMLNSLGSLFGFLVAPIILALFPSRSNILAKGDNIRKRNIVLPIPQLLAVFIDFFVVHISWNLAVGFFTTSNSFIEFNYKSIGLFIALFLVPLVWKGKTIGTAFMRYQLTNTGENKFLWPALLKRFVALYLPWVLYECLTSISQTELNYQAPFYVFHVWVNVGSLLCLLILIFALFIHAVIVIFKKGDRLFYFDEVADLIPSYKKQTK